MTLTFDLSSEPSVDIRHFLIASLWLLLQTFYVQWRNFRREMSRLEYREIRIVERWEKMRRLSTSSHFKYATMRCCCIRIRLTNPLMGTLKPQSNGIGILAVDGYVGTFGTARRGLGGLRPRPVPFSSYQM